MVYKSHLVELWVNGSKVELESQDSVNVRFNNVLSNPTKISSTQAEYSFEFELPCTPVNNKIFNYANNLSKLNKFRTRYNAELYADGTVIFRGTLTISSIKDKMYHVNLVSIKNYSLDDIFGDAVMYDISGTRSNQRWYKDFDGADSINAYNQNGDSEVMFPLVSYGVFQKEKVSGDSVSNTYTSKFEIDKYNRWYYESFYPSLNLVETMRKCFEYKDYVVGGDFFTDENLKEVYMSVNLADGQDPTYNLGNPKLGKVDLTVSWSSNTSGLSQDLKFPYLRTSQYNDKTFGLDYSMNQIEYNFDKIKVYDMLLEGNVTLAQSSYLYRPSENLIAIPADGFYKVEMEIDMTLNQSSSLTAAQWLATYSDWDVIINNTALKLEEADYTFSPDFRITTPIEIQLVKNYINPQDDTVELIKGKNNFMCIDGRVDNATTHGSYTNYRNFPTCFPHQKMGWMGSFNSLMIVGQITPTKTDYVGSSYTEDISSSYGYMYKDNDLMAYDQVVNPNFIMGATSMGNKEGGGCAAVIKNGNSWSKLNDEKYTMMYNQSGYQNVDGTQSSYVYTDTTVNQNTYPNAPQCTFSQTSNGLKAKIYALIHFNKNDILKLLAIHRDYNKMNGDEVIYNTSGTVKLKIEAASPKSYPQLIADGYGYASQIEFDDKLRLSNFLNKEKKISDWVQNIADAFNLEILQDGNNVSINVKKDKTNGIISAVDVDNRVNSAEAEASIIDYPKSMAVKYKLDAEEWGAENSVLELPDGEAKMNEDNWQKYIDSGYTIIYLNDDSYVTNTSEKNLPFSYTWYDNFTWNEVNSAGSEVGNSATLRIPCISKYSWMIDGYDYEESMKHDGYGLSQRFWFKPKVSSSQAYVWTETDPKEQVYLYIPSNTLNGLNLSYKNTERSLLTDYFDVKGYLASNYVTIEVYLTPIEYNRLKNGAFVHFDSDLYKVVEIEGYDPTGFNPTTLKIMKKTI